MSSRALRRLRENKSLTTGSIPEENIENKNGEDEITNDSSDDEGSYQNNNKHKSSNFAMLDSDSDSESDSDSDSISESDSDSDKNSENDDHNKRENNVESKQKKPQKSIKNDNVDDETDEEDLDMILKDFHTSTSKQNSSEAMDFLSNNKIIPVPLLYNFDIRNMDMEYTMGNILGSTTNAPRRGNNQASSRNKSFGMFPAPDWYFGNQGNANNDNNNPAPNQNARNRNQRIRNKTPKPPHFMGGGLAIKITNIVDKTHDSRKSDNQKQSIKNEEKETKQNRSIPFPYNDVNSMQIPIQPNQPHIIDPIVANTDDNSTNSDAKTGFERKTYSYPFYQQQTWYAFHPSSTYQQTQSYFQNLAQTSGDPNLLLMFAADQPFFAPILLQLSGLLFQTMGNREKAIELLKRVLFVYEHASTNVTTEFKNKSDQKQNEASFLPINTTSNKFKFVENQQNINEHYTSVNLMHVLMNSSLNDKDGKDKEEIAEVEENACFFAALFRYMQSACMVGCMETSLATARYLLSLDPLRDPMGVLMVMDYYALATANPQNTDFLIHFVESNMVRIHREDEKKRHHICHLLDMPNWSYHYALALRRHEQQQEHMEESKEVIKSSKTADEAIQDAIISHPSIVALLLDKNKVDTVSRSFRTDWQLILPKLQIMANTKFGSNNGVPSQGYEKVVSIFTNRSYKLWCADDTLSWLFVNCKKVVEKKLSELEDLKNLTLESDATITSEGNSGDNGNLSLALDRYNLLNPQDFADRYQMLPGDGNFLDANLMDLAMQYDPQRRSLLRQLRQRQGGRRGGGPEDDVELQRMLLEQIQRERNGDEVVYIDPDAPLAELFLQSMLPWARVQGVPPGGRR